MDEDRARFLAEWYGAGEAETSAEQADPAGTGYISSQIPPPAPAGASPGTRRGKGAPPSGPPAYASSPYWS